MLITIIYLSKFISYNLFLIISLCKYTLNLSICFITIINWNNY